MKILFIGNSYTYYNDMPSIFEKLANENGKEVEVFSVTFGGACLCQFTEKDNEYANQVEELIAKHEFDICILQEQSVLPIVDYTKFAGGVKDLVKKIKSADERIILYQTWGRKTGNEMLSRLAMTNESMTWALKEAYEKAAEEVGAGVSPVGILFHEIYAKHPEIELYDPDLTHPSYEGSCLAVMSLYKTIFGACPKYIESLQLSEEEKQIFVIKLEK